MGTMSIFTGPHYQAIAEVIAKRREHALVISAETHGVLRCLTEDFVRKLEKDNPNFDREKFLKACGMEGE